MKRVDTGNIFNSNGVQNAYACQRPPLIKVAFKVAKNGLASVVVASIKVAHAAQMWRTLHNRKLLVFRITFLFFLPVVTSIRDTFSSPLAIDHGSHSMPNCN